MTLEKKEPMLVGERILAFMDQNGFRKDDGTFHGNVEETRKKLVGPMIPSRSFNDYFNNKCRASSQRQGLLDICIEHFNTGRPEGEREEDFE